MGTTNVYHTIITGKEVVVGLSRLCVKGDSCLCTLMVLNVTTSVTSVCDIKVL